MSRNGTPVACALAVLFASPGARAQEAARPGTFSLPAILADEPPDIDGIVEDDEWAGAARVEIFVQFEPQRGAPATRRTVAFVSYDARHLYVAFRCLDDEPLTARRTQRDGGLRRALRPGPHPVPHGNGRVPEAQACPLSPTGS